MATCIGCVAPDEPNPDCPVAGHGNHRCEGCGTTEGVGGFTIHGHLPRTYWLCRTCADEIGQVTP